MQDRLNIERTKRQQAEATNQDKERQISMMNVDYRQIHQRVSKLEAENRQEIEKVCFYYSYGANTVSNFLECI